MIIWFALLIPFVGCIATYITWKYRFVWWELMLPTIVSFLFILITKFSVERAMTNDTQYMGGMIVEARYYEYWETWVTRTCSYTTTCCCDSKGQNCQTTTHYYDCSYCDHNNPYWRAYDDQGHSWSISKSEYNRLLKQWKATPQFIELNRDIDYHGSCGKDGDMYSIRWNGEMMTSETSTWEGEYTNKVQASKSNFNLKEISNKEAKKIGLYTYPNVDGYSQPNILGLDSLTYLNYGDKKSAQIKFEYFNGYYGPKRKIRLFILLFFDKPISIASTQQSYWDGGNKNEMVICIDVKKSTGEINWVYPFSWTENKRVAVDLREDISNLKILNFDSLYTVVDQSTPEFKYRDFDQYNYLQIDQPTWEIWFVYLMTLAITIGILWYGYNNEYVGDPDDENETNNKKVIKNWFTELVQKIKNRYKKLKNGY